MMGTRRFFLVVFFVLMLLLMGSCNQVKPNSIKTIEVITPEGMTTFDIDQFSLSDLSIKIEYINGTFLTIPVDSSMLTESDLSLLLRVGSHTITIKYGGMTTNYTIDLSYSELKSKLMEIYLLAVSSQQTQMTYEEWLNSIRGSDGLSIIDAYLIEGRLMLVLSDDSVIDVGRITGRDGQSVMMQVNQNEIQWKYEDDIEWRTLISLSLLNGINGIGISQLKIDDNGELWVTLSDDTSTNLGLIIGKNGTDGVSVHNISVNEYGHLIVTYSNNSTVDLGKITGESGAKVQMSIINNEIVWKYDHSDTWLTLIPLSTLTGHSGKTMELQVSNHYVQWRYVGDQEWMNLIELSSLVGERGPQGQPIQMSISNGSICWSYVGSDEIFPLIEISSLTGTSGQDGSNGTDGREVFFQVSDGYIQWQYTGDLSWKNLIDLSSLTGASGEQGADGREVILQVNDGYIQWQYTGDSSWNQLIEISTLIGAEGASGKAINLSVSSGYIGWSYEGDDLFHQLIEISTLAGSKGKGIIETEINSLGELIVYYDDQTSQNLGQLLKLHTVIFKDEFGYIIDVQMIVHGTDAVNPTPPLREGYVFIGWIGSHLSITKSQSIVTSYQPLYYTMTFDSCGGSSINPILNIEHNTSVVLPTPAREGYTFKGWFLGESIHDAQIFNTTKIKGDLTLYARWELNVYIVTFRNFQGTVLSYQRVIHGNQAIEPTVPFRVGFTHIGWDYPFENVQSNLTINALFSENIYAVTYYQEDGSFIKVDYVSHMGSTTPVVPDRENYVFTGWKIAEPMFNGFLFAGWNYLGDYLDQETLIIGNTQVVQSWSLLESTLNWIVVDDQVHLQSYIGTSERLYLPEKIEGKPVTAIKNGAFQGNSELTHLYLCSSIVFVHDTAFSESSIEYLVMNASVVVPIETTLFGFMGSLKTLIFHPDNMLSTLSKTMFTGTSTLERLELPKHLTTIESQTFMNHPSLKSLVIPKSVNYIGTEAFMASAFVHIEFELGSTLPIIYANTFKNAQHLVEVKNLPASVIAIETEAFSGNINMTHFSFELGSSLESIQTRSFYQALSLISLDIPSTVRLIGDEAFAEASSLKTLILPEFLTSMGEGAFLNNTNLEQITFMGNEIETIHYRSFYNAHQLYEIINFPASITTIGNEAFKNCYILEEFLFPEDALLVTIGNSSFENAYALSSLFIPNSLQSIGDLAFYNTTSLQSIVYGSQPSLITIGMAAFQNAQSLSSLIIPGSVVSIGMSAYQYCTSIKTIIFDPDGLLDEIGALAFANNSSVTQLDLPASLTSIDFGAFLGMTMLEEINFAEGMNLSYLGGGMFAENVNLLSIHLPEGLQTIVSGTFWRSYLQFIYLPSTITNVESYAFRDAIQINTVEFHPNSEIALLREGTFYFAHIERVILPNGLHEIQNYAFDVAMGLEEIVIHENSRLTILNQGSFIGAHRVREIYFPETVETLTVGILINLHSLESITISPNHPNYTTINGILYNKDVTELIFYPNMNHITSYEVPSSVHSIGIAAIDYAYQLNTLILHSGILTIGHNNLRGSTNLESIIVHPDNPNYVSMAGVLYSSDMKQLIKYPAAKIESTFILPSGVEIIETHAFANSVHLIDVLLSNGTLMSISEGAFSGCSSILHLVIPETVTVIGMGAFQLLNDWSTNDWSITFTFMRSASLGVTTLDGYVFGWPNFNTELIIYVPDDSFDDYYNHPTWGYYQQYLIPLS
jgi:uncharacterized repeat protein (TIGR02543 family)